MQESYIKTHSNFLDRKMESLVYGKCGKVCFVFPEQNGRYHDFKDFGMVEVARPWIEKGLLQIICVDSIDEETWSNKGGNPRIRIELQEKWFHYVTEELVPQYLPKGQKAMVTGCSMGGAHSGNFFFRRPDLFDVMLALSGIYNAQYFFNEYFDSLVYDNSPIHYLANMPENHPYMELYRNSRIIACVGQGLWENDLLESTRELDTILAEKGIPHWFDYWGYDVSHDWCWWQKQLSYFLGHIFG